MKTLFAAALFGLAFVQPVAAAPVLGDFNVYADGNVFISGGSYGDIASGSFTNANGPTGTNYATRQASSAGLTAQAKATSDALAALAPTGTFSALYGKGTLTGTTTGINVFSISATDLSPLYKLVFAGPGDGAVVNVTGTGSLMTSISFDLGAISDASKLVLNFVDLDSVWFNGLNLTGSVLAPDALVRLQGGNVAGAVIGKTFHSEGTIIGGKGFIGFSPSAGGVPEPSTWAMLILGFGLVGGALRRRAARPIRHAIVS